MRKSIDALFTSNTDDWRTPTRLYNKFMSLGFYDPCPYKSSVSLYGKVLKNKRIYMNPSFSQNKMWIKYAVDLAINGCDVWLLIACRTDTNYFRFMYDSVAFDIYFIQGRISFNDIGHAPFPVMLCHLCSGAQSHLFAVHTLDEFLDQIDCIYSK